MIKTVEQVEYYGVILFEYYGVILFVVFFVLRDSAMLQMKKLAIKAIIAWVIFFYKEGVYKDMKLKMVKIWGHFKDMPSLISKKYIKTNFKKSRIL